MLWTSCGPCGRYERQWEEAWSAQLAAAAIDDRPLYSSGTHVRLIYGEQALGALSSSPLKDTDLRPVRRVGALRSEAWGAGEMGLDLTARPTRVRLQPLETPAPGHDGEHEEPSDETRTFIMVNDETPPENALLLELLLTLSLRFDVPGYRSRWSWTATATVAAPVVLDRENQDGLYIELQQGAFLALEERVPWDEEQVPQEVSAAAQALVGAALGELIETEAGLRLRVLDLPAIALGEEDVRVAPLRVRPNRQERTLAVDLTSALRPARPLALEPGAGPDLWAIDVLVPASLIDAALQQQTVFEAEEMRVDNEGRFSEDGRWLPLWGGGYFSGDEYVGSWQRWCFRTQPCEADRPELAYQLDVSGDRLVPTPLSSPLASAGDEGLSSMTLRTLDGFLDFVTALTRGALTPGGGELGSVEAMEEDGDLRVRWSLQSAQRQAPTP